MCHVRARGVDERMINVHYHYYENTKQSKTDLHGTPSAPCSNYAALPERPLPTRGSGKSRTFVSSPQPSGCVLKQQYVWGEREREMGGDRQTDRQRQTETEGERERETKRERDKQTDRDRDRQRDRDSQRERQTETDRLTERERERGGIQFFFNFGCCCG